MFLRLLTGDTPQQCVDIGLDAEDSFHPVVTNIFTNGCCGNMAMVLQIAFGGQMYKSPTHHHVVTKIGDRVYDITGDVTGKYSDLTPITPTQLHDEDFINNYSYQLNGPIV